MTSMTDCRTHAHMNDERRRLAFVVRRSSFVEFVTLTSTMSWRLAIDNNNESHKQKAERGRPSLCCDVVVLLQCGGGVVGVLGRCDVVVSCSCVVVVVSNCRFVVMSLW